MFDPKQLDEIARKLAEALPPGVRDLQKDMERNFRAVLQSAFTRMDLVNREEVERLTDMLLRTRTRLEALEERLAVLEGTAPEPTNDAGDSSAEK
jgi:BMFP domain-containing protein YqiC